MKRAVSTPKNRVPMIRQLKLLQQLYRRRLYPEAIGQAERILQSNPANVPALILKARAIQLLNEKSLTQRYTLQAAKEALLYARAADPQSIEALNELAFYTRAVEDKSPKAHALFAESITMSMGQLRDALVGSMQCHVDANTLTEEEAARVLKRIDTALAKIVRQTQG